jgi:signal transduction histidine kinase
VDYTVNLVEDDIITLSRDAIRTLRSDGNRIINVIDKPDATGFAVEYTVEEAPLRAAMLEQSRTIWLVAGVISFLTGLLLFFTVFRLLVRPMRHITGNMIAFREAPEDASRVLRPTHETGELGEAERALSELQHDVRLSLRQKSRLAALGEAVAKINHDLRNILASAQLLTDRIAMSEDPTVQSAAPRLVAAIDRAVNLSTNVLKFGKEQETAPERRDLDLEAVMGDVAAGLDLDENSPVHLNRSIPEGFIINADSDHLFRILMNLMRNAVNAMTPLPDDRDKAIHVAARATETGWEIEIRDTGPGIPERIRESLFQAFVSSGPGGTGLGLAIAAELTRAHGGDLELISTGESGTTFLIVIPRPRQDEAPS